MRYVYTKGHRVKELSSDREIDFIRRIKRLENSVLLASDLPIADLVAEGVIPTPEGTQFDALNNKFVPMTDSELYTTGGITKQEYINRVKKHRQNRYKEESDPIFMDLVFEEIANGVPRDCTKWVSAVNIIKQELPYPNGE